MKTKEKKATGWYFDRFDRGYILDGSVYIAELVDSDSEGLFVKDPAERMKNGRLLAAAKDMFEALTAMRDAVANGGKGMLRAAELTNAALAKAKPKGA